MARAASLQDRSKFALLFSFCSLLQRGARAHTPSTLRTSACRECAPCKSADVDNESNRQRSEDSRWPTSQLSQPGQARRALDRAARPALRCSLPLNVHLRDRDDRDSTSANHLSGRSALARIHSRDSRLAKTLHLPTHTTQ